MDSRNDYNIYFFKLYSSKPLRAYQAVHFYKINCCEFFYLKIGPFFNNVDEIGISMIHTMA